MADAATKPLDTDTSRSPTRRLRALPSAIQDKLDAIASRIRRVLFVRGFFTTLAVAALALLAVMTIDAAFTIFSTGFRLALSLIALVIVLGTAWFALVRPLRRSLSPAEIARVLETRHPELEERISTAVELLDKDNKDPEALRGSSQLLDELVKAAKSDARHLRPRREFSTRTARRWIAMTAGAAVLIGTGYALWPKPTLRLMKRAVLPVASDGNLFADRLAVAPGSLRVAEGESLTITVDAPSGTERAELRTTFPGQPESVERMAGISGQDTSARRFTVTFPSVSRSFRYRIRSGKAISAFYDVEVIPRPVIEKITLAYRYPEYTGLPERTEYDSPGSITAVSGTKVAITARIDRSMKSAILHVNENPVWTNSQSGQAGKPLITWEVGLVPEMTGSWKIALEDFNGIRNRPESFPVEVLRDAPPQIRIVTPETTALKLKPTDSLNIGYLANDDYGIAIATLLVKKGGDEDYEPIPQELPVKSAEQGDDNTWIGEAALAIEDLQLGNVRNVEVRVALSDGIGQEAISDPITILIRDDAASLLEQSVAKQTEEFGAALWAALEKLNSAHLISAEKPATLLKLGDEALPQEMIGAFGAVQSATAEAEAITLEVAGKMAGTLFASQGGKLQSIAEQHIAGARQAAETVPLSDAAVTRVHQARLLVRHLEDAIAGMQNVLRSLQQNADNTNLVAQLNDLTDQQRELAELIADPRNRAILEDLQEEQGKLAERMKELMAQNQQSLAERYANTRENANDLADTAKALADDQAMLNEMLSKANDPTQREDATLDMLQWLEGEQREIGLDTRTLSRHVGGAEAVLRAKLAESSQTALKAADLITQAAVEDAAQAALQNVVHLEDAESGDPQIDLEIRHLLSWQESIASQLQALAGNDLDNALAAMQERIAEQSQQLAQNTTQFQQNAAQLAASQAVQQAMQAAQQANAAAHAAAQAAAQMGGAAMNAFRFDSTPGDAPPNSNVPANMPPLPTAAGTNAADDPLGNMVFGNNPGTRANTDLPPDIASLDGTAENPFSIGEASLETFPPAMKDDYSITGGDLPPDWAPPAEPGAPGAGAGGVGVSPGSGQGSGLGGAGGAAGSAGSGLASAAHSLATAAESLSPDSVPMDTPPIDPQLAEAMEQTMEAETPLEAAEKAAEAAEAMQSMMARLSTERAQSIKNWQRIRGQVKSGIASESQGSTPPEYRDLVKRYFEEIAKRQTQ